MITEEQEQKLRELTKIFLEENQKLNLSAFRTPEQAWVGNIVDSIAGIDELKRLATSIPQPLPPQEGGEPFKKGPLPNAMKEFSREMRKSPTPAEAILWERLRHDALGERVRRQYPFQGAIFDFFVPKLLLAIEVDGDTHDRTKDADRDTFFTTEHQVRTLRFTNQQVLHETDAVINDIATAISELQSSPPPVEEGSGVEEIRILDIGTGGGFPLLPLAICLPNWQFTGLDSIQKKIDAISRIAEKMNLTNINLLCGRTEELGHDPAHREQYDLVTSRAVAPLNTLLEFSSPFVKVGGFAVAWKSLNLVEELEESLAARAELSCHLTSNFEYDLGDDWGKRQLLFFEKTFPLKEKYPRDVGLPKKDPIA